MACQIGQYNMRPARKTAFVAIAIIAMLFFAWNAYAPAHLFINDTADRVQGSIIGSSSPTTPIDLSPGETKLIRTPWMSGTPRILKASPYARGIEPTANLVFIRIVRISTLPKW